MKSLANWVEIPVSDIDRATQFYESAFQIKLHRMKFDTGLTMAVFPIEGGVGGALCHHPDFYFPGTQGPLVYLNANPIMSEVISRLKNEGADFQVEQRQISEEHGSMAVFIDSEGNRIALHSDE